MCCCVLIAVLVSWCVMCVVLVLVEIVCNYVNVSEVYKVVTSASDSVTTQ